MPVYPRPRYLAAFALGIVVGVVISLAVIYIATPSTSQPGEELQPSATVSKKVLTNTSVAAGLEVGKPCLAKIVNESIVLLPLPLVRNSSIPLELALAYRRSLRHYINTAITIEQLSQLLWAADGINNPYTGFRTAPSAGATYPIVMYVVVGSKSVRLCNGKYLAPGSYIYDPYTHSLRLVRKGDLRDELAKAALGQEWVKRAAVDIVLCAVFQRTTKYYGERGYRYVYMEAGHIGQNIYLEAVALGLGTVAVGAFYDDEVQRVIGAAPDHHPIYIFPVGVPEHPYRVTQQAIQSFIEKHRAEQGLQK